MSKKLSHYDDAGRASMVDVSAKVETKRTAIAHAFVRIKPSVLKKLPENPKGNPLEVARFAGITAAKRTPDLIPMCHPLLLSHIDVEARIEAKGVRIHATVSNKGPTGVEMEALTAAAVAALTVYDMTKALDKGIEIQDLYLVEKDRRQKRRFQAESNKMIRVAIITISDSCVAGTREDKSGAALVARAAELGWTVGGTSVLPDEADEIAAKLAELADSGAIEVILTTGGTGIALRDVTPEAVRRVADREIPGFGEVMRSEGRKSAKMAPLSRGGGWTRGTTLIVSLPGSPRGAVDSLNAVTEFIPHVVDLLHGRTEHSKPGS